MASAPLYDVGAKKAAITCSGFLDIDARGGTCASEQILEDYWGKAIGHETIPAGVRYSNTLVACGTARRC